MSSAFTNAVTAQRQAADPRKNVFVAANAGSGKTRVLVDRVIRILLAQPVPRPDKIICLTYTKAAASEMQTRLFERLGAWSVMDDEALVTALDNLDGTPAARSPEFLARARRLFAQALETPEGLKVQTIHAFCERLLRRFPVEAQIAPGYDMIDDQTRAQLVEQIKSTLFARALAEPNGALAGAINAAAARNAQSAVTELLDWACYSSHRVMADGGNAADNLRAHFEFKASDTTDSLLRAAHSATDFALLRSIVADLNDKAANVKLAGVLLPMLEAPDDFERFKAYYEALLTKDGAMSAALSTGPDVGAVYGSRNSKAGYGPEGSRLAALNEQLREMAMVELTNIIFTLAVPAAKLYDTLKTQRRLLDFSDLIEKARVLLVDSESREWVRYKLDQGADHVLVDEAQDTAGDQWAIIDALTAEFGATMGDERTRFAVGDEKQSIYGFQGAEPELFLAQGRQTDLKNPAAFEAVALQHSFRSAREVLKIVDAIFKDCGAAKQIYSVPPAGDIAGHQAIRTDQGRVELWPLTRVPEGGEIDNAWDAPVDELAEDSSREQAAKIIAKSVAKWLSEGQAVWDVKAKSLRAMRPGDIMILMRSRSDVFHAIIRNLKKEGVAVAGADRLKLPDNIGVQDLVSLGKFLALPDDDLSLAELLRSPIFGLPEEALVALAIEREGTLFEAVTAAPFPEVLEVRGTLNKWITWSRSLAPYEFYARVLAYVFKDGTSVMARFERRLGAEARDPIEAFLSRALEHQRRGAPSLDGFIHEFETYQSELKREADSGGDEVRVMTVHGAKGLESPVVILPDTYDIPADKGKALVPQDLPELGYTARISKGARPASLSGVYNRRDGDMTGEYLRLLYVAMTRAETRLIFCGYETGGRSKELKAKDGSWYQWMERGFAALGDEVREEPHDQFGAIQVYGAGISNLTAHTDILSQTDIPDWAKRPPVADGPPPRHVTPSHLLAGDDAGPPSRSPLDIARSGHDRFERGRRIHKLLEILPDIEMARRRDVAQQFLSARADMSAGEITAMMDEIFTVLDHEDFAHIFAPGSQAEVSLAGQADGLPADIYINAQVDRITVTDTEVWIVDYKSNRPAPQNPEDVASIYIAQMAAYRALARSIYPRKSVHCALLWTDQARLMELPGDLLDGVDLMKAAARGDVS